MVPSQESAMRGFLDTVEEAYLDERTKELAKLMALPERQQAVRAQLAIAIAQDVRR